MGITDHLTATQLSGYLHRDLDGAERRSVEEHLDQCVECRAELVEVVRLAEPETRPVVKGLRRVTRRIWIPAAVAAGVAGLLLMRAGGPAVPPPSVIERPGGDFSESMPSVTVVSPQDGATTSGGLEFVWRSRGADTYRVTLLTESGELLWTVDTSDTVASLPGSVALAGGGSYFWRVEAIADGISAGSGVQRIEIAR